MMDPRSTTPTTSRLLLVKRQQSSRDSSATTPEEQLLHDDLMYLLAERTDTEEEALSQLVLAGVRVMAQHMDASRAGEAFLEVVRRSIAELRH